MANTGLYESDTENEIASPYHAGNRSDSDLDDESLVHVDVPIDGYFTEREHPQETFVENPSARGEEDKAKEASADRARARSSPSPRGPHSQHAATPARAAVEMNESAPLLDAGPAPPTYEAATADRREQGHLQEPNYGSISTPAPSQAQLRESFGNDHPLVRNGLFGEQRVLRSGSQRPQSMRDPREQRSGEGPASGAAGERGDVEVGLTEAPQRSQDKKKQRGWRWWCCCGRPMICLNVTIVFVVIVAIILVSRSTLLGRNHGGGGSNPSDGDDNPKEPTKPSRPSLPDHPQSEECQWISYSESDAFDFNAPGNFTFLEQIDFSNYKNFLPRGTSLSGTLKVAPAPHDQDVDIRVWVSVATTKLWSVTQLRYIQTVDALKLGYQEAVGNFEEMGRAKACMDVAALVQVRDGVSLDNWEVSTANLDVIVEDGLFLSKGEGIEGFLPYHSPRRILENSKGLIVRDKTTIDCIRGCVDVAYWSSRRTYVSTTSGRITGTYALRDLLSLDSYSGKIDIDVEPKKADPIAIEPADFVATSRSGQVDVQFPDRDWSPYAGSTEYTIPEREYRTHVESYSSKIRGHYILGSSAKFTSYSGAMDIALTPYSANAYNSTLRTETVSSRTDVSVREPLTYVTPIAPPYQQRSSAMLDWLYSNHKSTSGAMKLRYPQPWGGRIDGRSVSGHLDVRGYDLDVIREDRGPGCKRFLATNDDGHSKIDFATISGSVDLRIG